MGFCYSWGMSWLATVPLTTALTSEIYGHKKLGGIDWSFNPFRPVVKNNKLHLEETIT